MPKGLLGKRLEPGGMHLWFQCPCGHRWSGASQPAKNVAWRLHKKACELAAGQCLTNQELRPIRVDQEAKVQVVESTLQQLHLSAMAKM